eukprot:CAMPEP_0196217822 /NCGR_PEP_ID=MMETSP0912-20130531/35182_1 /TAXON_ID=49265 /ORGANISM="Thalassiosira rotula, Strain GSO102" /LENGTH=59 /DNA_ID=CAMNT_0041495349 /DNA_START=301 /DNA_END=476 /DNA_ORIENTATION=+
MARADASGDEEADDEQHTRPSPPSSDRNSRDTFGRVEEDWEVHRVICRYSLGYNSFRVT